MLGLTEDTKFSVAMGLGGAFTWIFAVCTGKIPVCGEIRTHLQCPALLLWAMQTGVDPHADTPWTQCKQGLTPMQTWFFSCADNGLARANTLEPSANRVWPPCKQGFSVLQTKVDPKQTWFFGCAEKGRTRANRILGLKEALRHSDGKQGTAFVFRALTPSSAEKPRLFPDNS